MLKIVYLRLWSGFANRLLPLLSAGVFCRLNGVKLAVIWCPHTHRSQLPETAQNNERLNLKDYFVAFPSHVTCFDTLAEALQHHGESKPQQTIDMQCKATFSRSQIAPNSTSILITNVCHVFNMFGNSDWNQIVGNPAYFDDPTLLKKYKQHPYILLLREEFYLYSLQPTILKTYKALPLKENYYIALQVRNTDGGFKKNQNEHFDNFVDHVLSSAADSTTVFYCTENPTAHNRVLQRYPQSVLYQNAAKFDNNDTGTFWALVDLLGMASSKLLYATEGSSFAQLAHIVSKNDNQILVYIPVLPKMSVDLATLLRIDQTFLLNLAKRTDRIGECRAEFKKLGVDQLQWERFEACLGSDKKWQAEFPEAHEKFFLAAKQKSLCNTVGAFGCLLSHYLMIKEAKKRNLKRILILEDDFEATEHFQNTDLLSKIGKLEFDMFYLATNIRKPSEATQDAGIMRATFVLSTCAYIINCTLFDFILQNCLQSAQPVDVFYAKMVQQRFKVLHSKEPIFVQRKSASDVAPTQASGSK